MRPKGGKAGGVLPGATLGGFLCKMSSGKELRQDTAKLADEAGSRAFPAHGAAGHVEGGKPTPLPLTA